MLAHHKRYWAEINLDAAENNFNIIKSKLSDKTKICCVIKADAYGHGAIQLARLYEKKKADYFAVSNIEEAIQLRKGGIKIPVMILGWTHPECADLLWEYNIEQTIFSLEYAKQLSENLEKSGKEIKVHLKLDSGMGRLGFSCKHNEEDFSGLDEAAQALKLKGIIPYGVFTHFAVSDEGDAGREYTKAQFESFEKAVLYLKDKHNIEFEIRHVSNSGAIFEYPEFQLDMVRAGIVLYCADTKALSSGLEGVMSLKAIISMVKDIKTGDCISYGCAFKANKDMTVATIPLGYADGFFRSNFEKAMVLVQGKNAPLIGRVCMDQIIVDVSEIPDAKMGDMVTIMGKENGEEISAMDIADINNTISYEILCAVGKRVPRYYIKNGKTIEITDDIL